MVSLGGCGEGEGAEEDTLEDSSCSLSFASSFSYISFWAERAPEGGRGGEGGREGGSEGEGGGGREGGRGEGGGREGEGGRGEEGMREKQRRGGRRRGVRGGKGMAELAFLLRVMFLHQFLLHTLVHGHCEGMGGEGEGERGEREREEGGMKVRGRNEE